jgi:hypothetical protein
LNNGGERPLLGYLFTVAIYKFEITANYVNYKHFVNKKGTLYEYMLPRGTQVKKGWEPLL